MNKKTGISLRIEEEKINKLDRLAKLTKRDRSFHINEAIENYLEVQDWQIDHINEALKQADNNEFASNDDILKVFGRWKFDGLKLH